MKKYFVMMVMALMAGSMNVNAASVNAESKANVKKVYTNRKNLHKLEYQTDDQGRVVSKITYAYDDVKHTYVPLSRYAVTYENDKAYLIFAAWDSAEQSFSRHQTMKVYDSAEFPVLLQMPETK